MEVVVILLTITLGDPLAKCWLPVLVILCSAVLEVLFPKEGHLSLAGFQGTRSRACHPLSIFMPVGQQAEKGFLCSWGVDPTDEK